MIDPEQVYRAFERHLERAQQLARWELVYPVGMGGISERWSLTFALSPEVGDVARLFPAVLPHYSKGENGGHTAEGRNVSFRTCTIDRSRYHLRPDGGSEIVIGVSGTQLPPWDGGVQDALLKTLVTELLPYVRNAETFRWTDSPFEDHDPPSMGPEKARALLARLTQERVLVEFDIDYFTRPACANPDLSLVLHVQPTCDSRCQEQTVNERGRTVWIEAGQYRAFARARVSSQPLLTAWPRVADFKKSRALCELWRSPEIGFELRPMRRYRFAVGLSKDRRSLTDEERRFIHGEDAKLDKPREILDFRLISDEPSVPWTAGS